MCYFRDREVSLNTVLDTAKHSKIEHTQRIGVRREKKVEAPGQTGYGRRRLQGVRRVGMG